jgi:hypothetical protein
VSGILASNVQEILRVTRPSKLAEMLAEVEVEGYTFVRDRGGWNIEANQQTVFEFVQPTKEACIVAAFDYVQQMRTEKIIGKPRPRRPGRTWDQD